MIQLSLLISAIVGAVESLVLGVNLNSVEPVGFSDLEERLLGDDAAGVLNATLAGIAKLDKKVIEAEKSGLTSTDAKTVNLLKKATEACIRALLSKRALKGE